MATTSQLKVSKLLYDVHYRDGTVETNVELPKRAPAKVLYAQAKYISKHIIPVRGRWVQVTKEEALARK